MTRPKCPACGGQCARRAKSAWYADGRVRYETYCSNCINRPWRRFKKDECELCGYDKCRDALDVHHKDGDRTNNSPDNLLTLCSNCHREEHFDDAPPTITL